MANEDDEARRQARITGEINAFVIFIRGAEHVIGKLEHARELVGDCLEFLERRNLTEDFYAWRRSRRAPGDATTQPAEVVELGPAGNSGPPPGVVPS